MKDSAMESHLPVNHSESLLKNKLFGSKVFLKTSDFLFKEWMVLDQCAQKVAGAAADKSGNVKLVFSSWRKWRAKALPSSSGLSAAPCRRSSAGSPWREPSGPRRPPLCHQRRWGTSRSSSQALFRTRLHRKRLLKHFLLFFATRKNTKNI